MKRRRTWACRVAILGFGLALLVAVVWVASRVRPVQHARSHSYVEIDRGRLYFGYTDAPADPRLLAAIVDGAKTTGQLSGRWAPRSVRGWGSSAGSNGRFFYTLVAVPIMPLAGVIAVLTGLAFALIYRRTPAGACAACGYDLRGSPGARCPECGDESIVTRIVRRLRRRLAAG